MRSRRVLTACQLVLGVCLALAALPGCGGDSGTDSTMRFQFVAMGDTRGGFLPGFELVDVEHFPYLAEEIGALEPAPEFLLFTGDAGLFGTQMEWNQWMGIMAPVLDRGTHIYPTLGNHEVFLDLNLKNAIAGFKARFQNPVNGPPGYEGLTFSTDIENIHLVCLTTNRTFESAMDDAQIEWLENDLARAHQRFTVVFFHAPAYPTGAHLGESLDVDPAERDKLWAVLDKAGVDLVFNGHEHNYSRATIDGRVNPLWKNGVVQVVAGGGGAPLANEIKVSWIDSFAAAFQYVVVEVHDNVMVVISIEEGGREIDRFSVS